MLYQLSYRPNCTNLSVRRRALRLVNDMSDEFHKPTQYSGSKFDSFVGGDDPAQISRIAHETAQTLLSRVRDNP